MAPLYTLFRNAWFVDDLYNAFFVGGGKVLALAMSGPVDNMFIDGVVNGVAGTIRWLGAELGRIQTGFVRNYALAILAGVVVIVGYMMRVGV
jgi:NADH-quinone oxidoreductase subunit L